MMPVVSNCLAVNCNVDNLILKNLTKYPWMVDITFHSFPTDLRERKIWYDLMKRGGEGDKLTFDKLGRIHRICSRHFVDGCPSTEHPHPTLFAHNNYGVSDSPRASKPAAMSRAPTAASAPVPGPGVIAASATPRNPRPVSILRYNSRDIPIGREVVIDDTMQGNLHGNRTRANMTSTGE